MQKARKAGGTPKSQCVDERIMIMRRGSGLSGPRKPFGEGGIRKDGFHLNQNRARLLVVKLKKVIEKF